MPRTRSSALFAAGTLVAGAAAGALAAHRSRAPAWAVPLAAAAALGVPAVAATTIVRHDLEPTAANLVTATRSTACAVVAGMAVSSWTRGVPARTSPAAAAAATAFLLDAVDGRIARFTRTDSPGGAELDVETDAASYLCFAVVAAPTAWPGLGAGALKYLFAAAARVRPHWLAPLAPRPSRRIAGAVTGALLVGALIPAGPRWLPWMLTTAATAVCAASFGRDVVDQERAKAGPRS